MKNQILVIFIPFSTSSKSSKGLYVFTTWQAFNVQPQCEVLNGEKQKM